MTRIRLILIAVIVFLTALFFYSVWKSGEGDRKADARIQDIHSHIRPGESRAELETYLQQIGAYASYESAATASKPAVERAVLFNIAQRGTRREDLHMEFYFSPDDALQYYFIRPQLVDPNAPHSLPGPSPTPQAGVAEETPTPEAAPTPGENPEPSASPEATPDSATPPEGKQD